MPHWAKYDRANGRIVSISEADQAPSEDATIAVIEVSESVRIGDFIGGPEGPQEPEQDLTPEAPDGVSAPAATIGSPPPKPKDE